MVSELKIGQNWLYTRDSAPDQNLWWMSDNLGGTVDEATGIADFPYGPREAFTSTPSGDLTINVDNTVVSGENRAGKYIINANNVTIEDCKAYFVRVNSGSGTIVEYSTIYPPDDWDSADGAEEAGISYGNYTIRYSEITNTFDGCKAFENVTIDNCYVHHMSCSSDAGNTGGGYAHGDGIQSGGGSGLTVTNSVFSNTGENGGIFLFRDGAGGYGTNPLTNIYITNCSILQCGNYGLWLEEAFDPGVPSGDKLITNVTIDNVYLGCARDTQYNLSCEGSPAPEWRGKLNIYFPTTSFTANWTDVYSLNGTASPDAIPLTNTGTDIDYCNIQIVL